MEIKRPFIFIFLLVFSIFYANAQTQSASEQDSKQDAKQYTQRIFWEKANNVFEYKVIIQTKDESQQNEYKTTQDYLEFSLPSGEYKYKIITIDYLGRESGQTEFTEFKIYPNLLPSISFYSNRKELTKQKNNTINIPIKEFNLKDRHRVEIVNAKTNKVIKALPDLSRNKKTFININENEALQEGIYFFLIKDFSDFAVKSDSFVITQKGKKVFIEQYKKDKKYDFSLESDNLVIKKVKKPQEMDFLSGFGYAFPIYPDIFKIRENNNGFFPVDLALLYFPTKTNKIDFGIEFNTIYAQRNSYQNIKTLSFFYRDFQVNCNLVYKKVIGNNNSAFNIKLGSGISVIDYSKRENNEETATYYNKNMFYNLNVSCTHIMYVKNFVAEGGLEYQNIFLDQGSAGTVRLVLRGGVRL